MQTKRMWNNVFFDLFSSLEVLSNVDAVTNYRNHIKNSKRTCNFQDFELLHLFFLLFYILQANWFMFYHSYFGYFWFLFQKQHCKSVSLFSPRLNFDLLCTIQWNTYIFLLCLILFARSFCYLAYFLIHHSQTRHVAK